MMAINQVQQHTEKKPSFLLFFFWGERGREWSHPTKLSLGFFFFFFFFFFFLFLFFFFILDFGNF